MLLATSLPSCLSGLLLALLALSAKGAEAGAWETFSKEGNSRAWGVLNYANGFDYYPGWADEIPGEEHAYFPHTGDRRLWFYADLFSNPGNGKLLGNYATEKVQSILVDALIDSLPDFSEVECIVLANGPAGRTFYYSTSYYDFEFGESGWYPLRFGFEEPWYFFNIDAGVYQQITVTPGLLASIEEIGFRFWRKPGSVASAVAAIDNVKLEPLVKPPPLVVASDSVHFHLAFTPGKATSCLIEQLLPSPASGWEQVAGHTDIIGPQEDVLSAPLSGRGFFRVQSSAAYTPFVTTP